MTSRAHGSELALASLACRDLAAQTGRSRPRVLIGGLGFGYTLRAALDSLPPGAEVSVWELSAMVLAANQGEVASLAGRPLGDTRVSVTQGDVRQALGKERFDAILLDVDDGPASFSLQRNRGLYSDPGLALLARSLVPGGSWRCGRWRRTEAFGRPPPPVLISRYTPYAAAPGAAASGTRSFLPGSQLTDAIGNGERPLEVAGHEVAGTAIRESATRWPTSTQSPTSSDACSSSSSPTRRRCSRSSATRSPCPAGRVTSASSPATWR